MENTSMTALVSAFARWYHAHNEGGGIFDDSAAGRLLTEGERDSIAASMCGGISYFNPAFTGTAAEALRWIVDNQLSPTPLARAAFAERHLHNAVRLGAAQYLILAAGYDTFAYRQPDWARGIEIFEIDHPATAQDKRHRLRAANEPIPSNVHYLSVDFNDDDWALPLLRDPAYTEQARAFCSLLGISYYLTKARFAQLTATLSDALAPGSSIVFDYPNERAHRDGGDPRAEKQAALAAGAGEAMQAGYTYADMERLLDACGFLIYEHLTPPEINVGLFADYNRHNPDHPITAIDNVSLCLAVKR